VSETILRQFYVAKDIGLTILEAEQRFGVEIRSLTIDPSDVLFIGRLISVEGSHDNVYRLFDKLCPGVLNEKQVNSLKK
jgi:hypothetical protein